MKTYTSIEITFKDGSTNRWTKDMWSDFSFDGHTFIVKDGEAWIGFYNMDTVKCIVVK